MTHRGHVSVVFKFVSFRHAVIYQYMSSSDDPNLRLLVREIDDLEDYTVVFYKLRVIGRGLMLTTSAI